MLIAWHPGIAKREPKSIRSALRALVRSAYANALALDDELA